MSHGTPGVGLASRVGDQPVATHRRAAAAGGCLAGAAVVVAFWAMVGLSLVVAPAAVGTAGLVYAGGIELACRRYGHAVDCDSGSFCECERCGRPVADA